MGGKSYEKKDDCSINFGNVCNSYVNRVQWRDRGDKHHKRNNI